MSVAAFGNGADVGATLAAKGVTVDGKVCSETERRDFADGWAVRYILPGGERHIEREETVWTLPTDAKVWYQEYGGDYEKPYSSSLVREIPVGTVVNLPVTAKLADGTYRLITEANVVGYTDSAAKYLGTGHFAAEKSTPDVFIYDKLNNSIGVWITDERGNVSGWASVEVFSSSTTVLGLGDFNTGSTTDLLLRDKNGAVGCFLTDGETPGWHYFQSLGPEWEISAVGDVNNDLLSDMVLRNEHGYAGCWLTNADGTVSWRNLDTLADDFEIVGAGDFNGDGTDDILLKKGSYYGAWIVREGSVGDWMGLGDLGGVTVEQIGDFDGDGIDDLRIRTAAGDLGAELVRGADDLEWKYYGSVGSEWKTSLAAI